MRVMVSGVGVLMIGLPAQEPARAKSDEAARIADLIERLKDKAKAPDAEYRLLRASKLVVPALMKTILVDGRAVSTQQSKRALVVLGRLGPKAASSAGALFEALMVSSDAMYLDLMRAIADLVPYSEYQGDPRLVERLVLANRNAERWSARPNDRQRFQYEFNRLQQRSQVNPTAGSAAMIREVERNRTHRREVAAEVLGRLGASAKSAIPALAKTLRKGAPVVGQIGGFSVPKYRDGYPRAASEAMIAIDPHDPRASIAWGWLVENSPREEIRWTAALRIGSFGADGKEQVDSLVGAVRDESPRVRHEAITALGMIGPDAKKAIFTLKQLASGPDKAMAARARASLRRIQAESEPKKRRQGQSG